MDPCISLDTLVRTRGSFTLYVPSLKVAPGTVVGLVGRNGAGKTSLLEVLAGRAPATAGTVRVLGADPMADVVIHRRRVTYMTDTQPVFPLRVGALIAAMARFYPAWDHELARQLVERFELPLRADAEALSKGEGTRLRLVLALAPRPQLLLLDEPGTGLDVVHRRAMLEGVLDVVRDPTRTVVFSTHQVDDVERIAERVVVLRRGQILADGPTDEIVGEGRNLEQMLVEEG